MPRTKLPGKILPSELRVLDLISRNNNYQEAADVLFISKNTAYTEVKNARIRNNVKNTETLLRLALEDRLLPLVFKDNDAEDKNAGR